jgi:hypothetical protein
MDAKNACATAFHSAYFFVGGYVPGRYGVEELVVGEKRDGDFYFVASIKNGFVLSTRQKVFDAIKGREIEKCPFVNLPEKKGPHRMDREKMATVRWLRLRIVAEIAFNERTNAGHLRHSKFFACGIVQMYAQKQRKELALSELQRVLSLKRATAPLSDTLFTYEYNLTTIWSVAWFRHGTKRTNISADFITRRNRLLRDSLDGAAE